MRVVLCSTYEALWRTYVPEGTKSNDDDDGPEGVSVDQHSEQKGMRGKCSGIEAQLCDGPEQEKQTKTCNIAIRQT